MQFPVNLLVTLMEGTMSLSNQPFEWFLVTGQVAEIIGMLQGKLQRFDCLVKTEQVDGAVKVASGAQNRYSIGRRSQADVPNHEFTLMLCEPLPEPKLAHIKGFGLRNRADNRMEGFAMRERMNAVNALGQSHKLIAGANCHGGNFRHPIAEAKRKCWPDRPPGGVKTKIWAGCPQLGSATASSGKRANRHA